MMCITILERHISTAKIIEKAAGEYERAVEINQSMGAAYKMLGVSYYYMQEYKKSAEKLKIAKDMGEEVPEELYTEVKRLAKIIKQKESD